MTRPPQWGPIGVPANQDEAGPRLSEGLGQAKVALPWAVARGAAARRRVWGVGVACGCVEAPLTSRVETSGYVRPVLHVDFNDTRNPLPVRSDPWNLVSGNPVALVDGEGLRAEGKVVGPVFIEAGERRFVWVLREGPVEVVRSRPRKAP